ncbi:hypothetical protein AAG570_007175 [Ranatra chinensis]|uniref:C2H2-type domain-containing protein n=1 Tax=Ranatra chinensis TaxID=642074 RepID=A0ABD0YDN5_9HEMI
MTPEHSPQGRRGYILSSPARQPQQVPDNLISPWNGVGPDTVVATQLEIPLVPSSPPLGDDFGCPFHPGSGIAPAVRTLPSTLSMLSLIGGKLIGGEGKERARTRVLPHSRQRSIDGTLRTDDSGPVFSSTTVLKSSSFSSTWAGKGQPFFLPFPITPRPSETLTRRSSSDEDSIVSLLAPVSPTPSEVVRSQQIKVEAAEKGTTGASSEMRGDEENTSDSGVVSPLPLPPPSPTPSDILRPEGFLAPSSPDTSGRPMENGPLSPTMSCISTASTVAFQREVTGGPGKTSSEMASADGTDDDIDDDEMDDDDVDDEEADKRGEAGESGEAKPAKETPRMSDQNGWEPQQKGEFVVLILQLVSRTVTPKRRNVFNDESKQVMTERNGVAASMPKDRVPIPQEIESQIDLWTLGCLGLINNSGGGQPAQDGTAEAFSALQGLVSDVQSSEGLKIMPLHNLDFRWYPRIYVPSNQVLSPVDLGLLNGGNTTQSDATTNFPCDVCGDVSPSRQSLEIHKTTAGHYRCPVSADCPLFSSPIDVNSHYQAVHGGGGGGPVQQLTQQVQRLQSPAIPTPQLPPGVTLVAGRNPPSSYQQQQQQHSFRMQQPNEFFGSPTYSPYQFVQPGGAQVQQVVMTPSSGSSATPQLPNLPPGVQLSKRPATGSAGASSGAKQRRLSEDGSSGGSPSPPAAPPVRLPDSITLVRPNVSITQQKQKSTTNGTDANSVANMLATRGITVSRLFKVGLVVSVCNSHAEGPGFDFLIGQSWLKAKLTSRPSGVQHVSA